MMLFRSHSTAFFECFQGRIRSFHSARHQLAADSAEMPQFLCELQLFFRIHDHLKARDWVRFAERYGQTAQAAQRE